jgi:peptide/nickel transport system substrate-binding protein
MTVGITRRTFTTLAALTGIGQAASIPAAAGAVEPRRGGTLNLLVHPEPPVLVSLTNSAGPTTRVSAKVTEGLLTVDFNLKPGPQLAEHWSVNADGTEYTFDLRKGVRWHDGKDFTSADVAASILLLKDVHPRGRVTFANVTEVRTPDPHTAIIILSKPSPYLLIALTATESPIVPKHLYEATDPIGNRNTVAPIGTGPFIFKEWVTGSHIIYERNPDYWDRSKPYLDRIVVKIIPDASARVIALETGEADLAADTIVPLNQLDHLKTVPTLGFELHGYEYQPTVFRETFNLSNLYLKNLKVRQAIAHALDWKTIVDVVMYGYGERAPTAISPELKGFYNAAAPVYDFDPRQAERLLDEAGFPRGPDGVRFQLTDDYMPYGDAMYRLAEYSKAALRKVGIAVTLRTNDIPTWFKRIFTDYDFDYFSGGIGHMFDPTAGVQRLYWSKNFKKGVPLSNASGYQNPEVDRLLEAAAVEFDPAKRRILFEQFQVLVAQDLPDVNLVTGINITIYNKRVMDHTTTGDGLAANQADTWLKA